MGVDGTTPRESQPILGHAQPQYAAHPGPMYVAQPPQPGQPPQHQPQPNVYPVSYAEPVYGTVMQASPYPMYQQYQAPQQPAYQTTPGQPAQPPAPLGFNVPEARKSSLLSQILWAPFELRSFAALLYYVFLSVPLYFIGAPLILTFAWLSIGFVFLCCIGIPMFAGVAVFIRAFANLQISVAKVLLPPRDPTCNVMKYPTLSGKLNTNAMSWLKSSLTSALTWKALAFYHFLAMPWCAVTASSVQAFYVASLWCIATSLFWIFGVNPFSECVGCGGFLSSPASFILLLPVGVGLYWITSLMALWLGYLERNMLWRILGYRVVDRNDFGRYELVLPEPSRDANGIERPLLPLEVVDPTNPERKAVYGGVRVPDMHVKDYGSNKKNLGCLIVSTVLMVGAAAFMFFLIWNFNLYIRCTTSSRLTSVKTYNAALLVNNYTNTSVDVVYNLDCPNFFNIMSHDYRTHYVEFQDHGPAVANNTYKVRFDITTSVVKQQFYAIDELFAVSYTYSRFTGQLQLVLDFRRDMSWKERVFLCTQTVIQVTLPMSLDGSGATSVSAQTQSQPIIANLNNQNFQTHLERLSLNTGRRVNLYMSGNVVPYNYTVSVEAGSADIEGISTTGSLDVLLRNYLNLHQYYTYSTVSFWARYANVKTVGHGYVYINNQFLSGYGYSSFYASQDSGYLQISTIFPRQDRGDGYYIDVKGNDAYLQMYTYTYNGTFSGRTISGSSYNFQQCGAASSTVYGSRYTQGQTYLDPSPWNSLSVTTTGGRFYYYGQC